jgi:hypothetical protein
MSNLPSQQTEAPTFEALSDDELQAVSGGVSFAIGRPALAVSLPGRITPFNCGACVQGIPFNHVNNPAVNPVLNAPLGRF